MNELFDMVYEGERFLPRVVASVWIGSCFKGSECGRHIILTDRRHHIAAGLFSPVRTHQEACWDTDHEQQSQEGEEESATFLHRLLLCTCLFEHRHNFRFFRNICLGKPQGSVVAVISNVDICMMS